MNNIVDKINNMGFEELQDFIYKSIKSCEKDLECTDFCINDLLEKRLSKLKSITIPTFEEFKNFTKEEKSDVVNRIRRQCCFIFIRNIF